MCVSRIVLELHTHLQKKKNRRLIVYLALSVHPVLKNHLTCPVETSVPTIPLGIFSEPMQKTAQERMHIMTLLLSLIGHCIPKDPEDGKIRSFVSTAIGDGLNEVQTVISTLPPPPKHLFSKPQQFSPLQILWSVKDITLEFAQRILANTDRLDIDTDEQDSSISVSSLGEVTYRQYKYDVKRSPSTLLRPQSAIIVPKTKLTNHLIHQLISKYHLGGYFRSSKDEPCFWRASLFCKSAHHIVQLLHLTPAA